MDLWQQVDDYCERTDFSFWSEPLNFLSNGFFLIAAVWVFRLMIKQSLTKDPALRILTILLFLIGIGSGLFHSFATRWAVWCDVIPILLFVLAFLGIWCRQVLALGYGQISLAYLGFFVVSGLLIKFFADISVGGSQGYFGVILFLIGLGFHQKVYLKGKPWLLYAGIVFAVSLFFRSIDKAVCDVIPIGTHFIWHFLNSWTLFLVLRALIDRKTRDTFRLSRSLENPAR